VAKVRLNYCSNRHHKEMRSLSFQRKHTLWEIWWAWVMISIFSSPILNSSWLSFSLPFPLLFSLLLELILRCDVRELLFTWKADSLLKDWLFIIPVFVPHLPFSRIEMQLHTSKGTDYVHQMLMPSMQQEPWQTWESICIVKIVYRPMTWQS
jgi:hypothetical protein